MFHAHLDWFPKPPLGGRPNTKPRCKNCGGRPWHSECSQLLIYSILSCVRTRMNNSFIQWYSIWLRAPPHMTSHFIRESATILQYMTLEVPWDGLWALSFGLSQFHGYGSWLMCEVAIRASPMVMDPQLHLHFFIRVADVDPGMWPSGPFNLQIRMKNHARIDALPA